MQATLIAPGFLEGAPFQHIEADRFPTIHPIHWLHSHFAVGGWSPLQRLSGMLTAHMTQIAPHNGFTWHPHRGLEIYTWVVEGTLHHEDSTGGGGDISAGEIQRMFSGDYIEHQELNLTDKPARVIQIWFAVDQRIHQREPHYQQAGREQLPMRTNGTAHIYSLIGADSPMQAHVAARLEASELAAGKTSIAAPQAGENLFLYVTDGRGTITYGEDGQPRSLAQYDVILARPDSDSITIATDESLSYLSFYLPTFMASAN